MLLPVAIFLHVARSSRDENLQLIRVLVACATVSGLIGALQLAAGHPHWLSFFDGSTAGAASGIFANPNHQSLMMVCAMVACAILIRSARDGSAQSPFAVKAVRTIPWALLFFFAIMALATGARAGVVLLFVALPGSLLVAMGSGSLLRWAVTMLGALALLWIVVLLYPDTNSLALHENFRLSDDARYAYLPDIIYTLGQYWSAGSGLGTFVDVFTPNENLDYAQHAFLNHAHNDYLEWLIETGLVGAIYLALAVLVALWTGHKIFRDKSHDIGTAAGGVLIVLLIALHSLADYPLRTATISTMAAIALGLLPACLRASERSEASGRKLVPAFASALVALPLAAMIAQLFAVQSAVRSGQQSLALRLGPTDGRVLTIRAEQALRGGNAREAERLAAQAVDSQPMNVAAIRIAAMARDAQRKQSGSAWRLASALGWRDAPTQLWAFRQALFENEPEIAALRADALLRTGRPPAEFVQLLRLAARDRNSHPPSPIGCASSRNGAGNSSF